MKNTKNLFLLIISMIAFLIFSAEVPIFTVSQKKETMEKKDTYIMNLAEKEALILESRINEAGNSSRTLAELIMHGKQNEELYSTCIEDDLMTDSIISGMGYWFEPLYKDQHADYTGSYFYYDGQKENIEVRHYNTDEYDYTLKEWYLDGMAAESMYHYTGPYYDEDLDTYYLTISAKITRDHKDIGLATAEITLLEINDYINSLDQDPGVSFVLITEDGMLVGKNNQMLCEEDLAYSESFLYEDPEKLARICCADGAGTERIGDYLTAYAPIKDTGLKLVAYYAKSDLLTEIYSHTTMIVVSFIISMFFFVLALNIFLHHFVEKPLKRILMQYKLPGLEEEKHLKFDTAVQSLNRLFEECSSSIEQRNSKASELEAKKAELQELYGQSADINLKLYDLLKEVRDGYSITVQSLSNAIEANDLHTQGHSLRVTAFALKTAKKLNLTEKECLALEYAAILHDIGNIGIPIEILNKPAKLTAQEFLVIQRHPVIGYEIIKDIDFLKDSARMVLHHHERIDGKGYPDGLKGEELDIAIRILTVVDDYDAMTSSRPYRKEPLSSDIALTILKQGIGTRFDARAVSAFEAVLKEKS